MGKVGTHTVAARIMHRRLLFQEAGFGHGAGFQLIPTPESENCLLPIVSLHYSTIPQLVKEILRVLIF